MTTTNQLLASIHQGAPLFIIVDVNQYQDPLVLFKLVEGMESRPLFRDTPYRELIPYSPLLIRLNGQNQSLVDDIFHRLAGCIIESTHSLDDLNQILGEMLLAEQQSQGKVYARFFSPPMARTILQSTAMSHCWRGCSQVWLPCYRGEKWVQFERPQYNVPATLIFTQKDEQVLHAEHLTYLLAKSSAWQDIAISHVILAAQSLAQLAAIEPLSTKNMTLWSEWLAANLSVMTDASWMTLITNPISNNAKWQRAQELFNQVAENTHA
ncbi:DUF4123 domain-containing protein [Vibrio sinensis]|uniref:DUF4123 domain-containing protein n=2 Tax=Vibrio sinensis TaxID=2302434 RepID=A0A3A6QIA9_9VIBR|nr:DUF4123 domain-containing protein [Vibrio sinensis]